MKKIRLHYPSQTIPVSVTGKWCGLNCRHCAGRYLSAMKPIAGFDINNNPGLRSLLISGGCNKSGAVPVYDHIDELRRLKSAGYRLNIHTGLVPDDSIDAVVEVADVVSYDFIVDDETIAEVYDHGRTGADYINTLIKINNKTNVMPHVTIGIRGGRIKGEYAAISTLQAMGFERIVFLVFIPTRGTAYEDRKPPPLDEVEKVLRFARNLLPDASFSLGCMHPRGSYKKALEALCLDCGFDAFVNPTKGFRRRLEESGYEIKEVKECCAFGATVSRDVESSGS